MASGRLAISSTPTTYSESNRRKEPMANWSASAEAFRVAAAMEDGVITVAVFHDRRLEGCRSGG